MLQTIFNTRHLIKMELQDTHLLRCFYILNDSKNYKTLVNFDQIDTVLMSVLIIT